MFHRKTEEEVSAELLQRNLDECRERREFLALSVRALACYLKDFSLDVAEIDSSSYKKHIDEMTRNLLSDSPVRGIENKFEKDHKQIATFICKEKAYITNKEAELKNLIELLRKGLTEVIGESRDFGDKISQNNMKLEQIVNLDDIRRMKESLRTQIAQARDIVREKQMRDGQLLNRLEKEVDILRTDLERVHRVATTDPLTGANNRYSFDAYLHECVERNVILWKPFSILLCDLDNFKGINDTYGHRVGDAVLSIFVSECRNILRKDDYIARYGGDEFVLMLSGANLRQAVNKANTICQLFAMRKHVFNSADGQMEIPIGVSIGVAEARRRDTAEALVERADCALYKSKECGRNRASTENDVKKAA
jgi:diguanylate cyclase